jgi:hypothetical protein
VQYREQLLEIQELPTHVYQLFFFFVATAQIWALAFLHETLRFISVF